MTAGTRRSSLTRFSNRTGSAHGSILLWEAPERARQAFGRRNLSATANRPRSQVKASSRPWRELLGRDMQNEIEPGGEFLPADPVRSINRQSTGSLTTVLLFPLALGSMCRGFLLR